MNWMDVFIEHTLEKVPEGRYRKRAEAELRDHLETQFRALIEAGWTEDEAQAETLRVMGEPEKLQGEYEAAWRRSLPARLETLGRRLGVIAAGCFLMGALYIYTAMFLSLLGFTYDGVSPHPQTLTGRNFPILGDGPALTIFGASLFLIPFPLGALFLKFRFQRERRPTSLVTAGLLSAWAGEKAVIIGLSALIYQMPLGLDLLHRISRGGDVTGPWFTPTYIVLTFVGCLLLGQLFGRLPMGAKTPRTAQN